MTAPHLDPDTRQQAITACFKDGAHRKLYWCSHCNVPLLTPLCFRCGAHGRKFVADVKPVFVEERQLLEEVVGKKLPDQLFASNSRIYYRGKILLSLFAHGGQVTAKADHTDTLSAKDTGSTNGRLSLEPAVEANMPVLRYLEQEAVNSIIDVSQNYPTRKPVVSFSGGKDSAVVAALAQKAIGDTGKVALFFGDTTLEHPETENYVVQFANYFDLALNIKRAPDNFFQMCAELEPPSRIMRWCCTVFKANPLNEYLREQGNILSFDGIRREESNRRRSYDRISGNKKALKQLVFRPILNWSTLAVWLYIFAEGIPYNPAYDKGYARVGCVICPFSTDYNDFLAKRNYPEKVAAWEAMLTQYFKHEYGDKFRPEFAEEWIRQGLWKKRKPHHKNQTGSLRVSTCPSLKECVYQLESPISNNFIEYLKPLGDLTLSSESGFFTVINAERFHISGAIGDDSIFISFARPKFRQDMYLVERQIKKAMNCVQCGACAATCPFNAISVCSSAPFQVNENLCNHCLSCVKSNFTHYGCVALSYKRERNWIMEE